MHKSTTRSRQIVLKADVLGWNGISEDEPAKLFGLPGVIGFFLIAPLTSFVAESGLDRALTLAVTVVTVLVGFGVPTILVVFPLIQNLVNGRASNRDSDHFEGNDEFFSRPVVQVVQLFSVVGICTILVILVYFAWPPGETRSVIGGLASSLVFVCLVSIVRYPRLIMSDILMSSSHVPLKSDSHPDTGTYGSSAIGRTLDLLVRSILVVASVSVLDTRFGIPIWSLILVAYLLGVLFEGLMVSFFSATLGLLAARRYLVGTTQAKIGKTRQPWIRAAVVYSPIIIAGLGTIPAEEQLLLDLAVLSSFTMMLLNSGIIHAQKRGAHDIVAGTVIVPRQLR